MGRLTAIVGLIAWGASLALGADAGPAGPVAAEPDGVLVIAALSPERAVVADPRTGDTRSRRLPGGTLCHGPLMAVGDRVLWSGLRSGGAVARSLPLTLGGRPRSLSAADSFTRSAAPGRIWLGDWTGRLGRSAGVALREIDLEGRMLGRERQPLPRFTMIQAALDDGLLVTHGRRLTLWGRRSGRPLRSIRDGWPIAASGSSFAWCGPRCRGLGVWSRAGERRVHPPAGLKLQAADGAFSPDGRRLAVVVSRDGSSHAAVIDLESRDWSLVPGVELDDYQALAWSPSGRWLYLAAHQDRLVAWRPGAESAVRLPIQPGGRVMSIDTAR